MPSTRSAINATATRGGKGQHPAFGPIGRPCRRGDGYEVASHVFTLLAPLVCVAVLCVSGAESFAADEIPGGSGPAEMDVPLPVADAAEPVSAADPLERAIRGMRDAQKRIANRKTDQDTLGIQDDVIRSLDELIKRASQSPPPDGGNSGSPDAPNPQPRQQASPESEQQQSPEESEASAESAPEQAGSEPTQSGESEARAQNADKLNAELENRRRLLNEVWGHLPPTLRERLLNANREKPLPKYADQIRRYFEALAEQDQSR